MGDIAQMARIDRRYWVLLALMIAAMAVTLLAMGRVPICTCGTIKLWHGIVNSPENSQHIADWYSPSHVIHGFIFYWISWLALRQNPMGVRLLAAAAIEVAWEIAENTPMIINRYREATMALGYTGDSIINSVSDVIMMVIGFTIAMRLPPRWTIIAAIAMELLALAVIRDNLTLNVLMLVYPVDGIRVWQAGA